MEMELRQRTMGYKPPLCPVQVGWKEGVETMSVGPALCPVDRMSPKAIKPIRCVRPRFKEAAQDVNKRDKTVIGWSMIALSVSIGLIWIGLYMAGAI